MIMTEHGAAPLAAPAERRESGRIMRFLVAGAVNTGLSVLVYQAALFIVPHTPAYVLSYIVGILAAYFLYSRHVFDASINAARFTAFAVFYIASLVIGTLVNAALIEEIGVTARLAIFITIALMLPVNYLGSRWCLRVGPRNA
jgi:putative flippase GtrA